jgi:hypothetical protein
MYMEEGSKTGVVNFKLLKRMYHMWPEYTEETFSLSEY